MRTELESQGGLKEDQEVLNPLAAPAKVSGHGAESAQVHTNTVMIQELFARGKSFFT